MSLIPEPKVIKVPDGNSKLLILGCSGGRKLFFHTIYATTRKREIGVSLEGPKMCEGEFRKAIMTARKLLKKEGCRIKVRWRKWKNIDPRMKSPARDDGEQKYEW
jgi:hypothetical protein